MKKILLYLCWATAAALYSVGAWSEHTVPIAFNKIKSLVGDWQGTLPDGKSIDISYREISGYVILEVYHSTDPMWWNMSSVYHADVDKVIMSHYCSWGNHPRMTSQPLSSDGTVLDFNFLDMTETAPDHGYMHNVSFHFQDEDHFSHHWVWRENGQDKPLVVTMARKKAT